MVPWRLLRRTLFKLEDGEIKSRGDLHAVASICALHHAFESTTREINMVDCTIMSDLACRIGESDVCGGISLVKRAFTHDMQTR